MNIRTFISHAIAEAVDRFIGSNESRKLSRGDKFVVSKKLESNDGGVLMVGSEVMFTGSIDFEGRMQIYIESVPDFDWTPEKPIPYGPGFTLFVESAYLTPREEK